MAGRLHHVYSSSSLGVVLKVYNANEYIRIEPGDFMTFEYIYGNVLVLPKLSFFPWAPANACPEEKASNEKKTVKTIVLFSLLIYEQMGNIKI